MRIPASRTLARVALMGLCLTLGLACKRPETALRERPAQRVEVVLQVEGVTPEEERAVAAQLAEGLGASVEAAGPPTAPGRVFRLTLRGKPNPNAQRGLGKTLLVSTAYGALLGALAPALGYTFWATARSAAIATGAGGLLGFAYGPTWFRNNQDQLKELGYLPFGFTADWEVLERRPGSSDEVVASSGPSSPFTSRYTPILNLKPHLKPLPPESRSGADVRQASLRAYVEALLKRFGITRRSGGGRGASLQAGSA